MELMGVFKVNNIQNYAQQFAVDTNKALDNAFKNVQPVKGFKGAILSTACGGHAVSLTSAYFSMHTMLYDYKYQSSIASILHEASVIMFSGKSLEQSKICERLYCRDGVIDVRDKC